MHWNCQEEASNCYLLAFCEQRTAKIVFFSPTIIHQNAFKVKVKAIIKQNISTVAP